MWRGEAAELNLGSYSPGVNGVGRPSRRAQHRRETPAGGGGLSDGKGGGSTCVRAGVTLSSGGLIPRDH